MLEWMHLFKYFFNIKININTTNEYYIYFINQLKHKISNQHVLKFFELQLSKFKRILYIKCRSYSTNKLPKLTFYFKNEQKKESRVSIFSKIEQPVRSSAQISQETRYIKKERSCIFFSTIIRNHFFEAASRTITLNRKKKEARPKRNDPSRFQIRSKETSLSLSNTDSTAFQRTIEKAPKNRVARRHSFATG